MFKQSFFLENAILGTTEKNSVWTLGKAIKQPLDLFMIVLIHLIYTC